MPIQGDRLRWPPRVGKKPRGFPATKRTLTDESSVESGSLRLPNERDQSPTSNGQAPHAVMQQAHRDVSRGQQDTDCRNQAASTIRHASTHKP